MVENEQQSIIHTDNNKQESACFKVVKLNENISFINFISFLINCFFVICLLVFVNAEQAFLLTEVYHVPSDNLGTVSGQLSLADEITSIFALVISGALSDKFGRKVVVVLGYIVCGVALFLMPHGRNFEEHPGDLICLRLLYALGSAALASTLTALLADYVDKEFLGKAAGIMGLASGGGAVFTVFVLVRLPVYVCLTPTYYITGSIAIIIGMLMYCTLGETNAEHMASSEWAGLEGIVTALKLIKKDAIYGMSYLTGFSSRGAAVTISVYISLWINKYFDQNNLCFVTEGNVTNSLETEILNSQCAEELTNPEKETCPEAFTQSSTINGIVQAVALITAPIGGIICDLMPDAHSIFILAAGFAAASYSLVYVVKDPTSSAMMGIATMLGAAEILLVVTSQWLVTNQMPEEVRGAVAGFYSLCGGLGVIFFVNVGGILFDRGLSSGPFLLVGISNAIFFVLGICLLVYRKCNTEVQPKDDSTKKTTSHIDSNQVPSMEMQRI